MSEEDDFSGKSSEESHAANDEDPTKRQKPRQGKNYREDNGGLLAEHSHDNATLLKNGAQESLQDTQSEVSESEIQRKKEKRI